jgi:hypothetical protein
MSRPFTLTGYQKPIRNKVSHDHEWCELASAAPHHRGCLMDAGGGAVGLPPPKFTCSQPKSDLTGRMFKGILGLS